MTVRVSKPAFNLREKLSELDKPTGIKGTELMRSETSQEVRDLIGTGRKNKLYNGAMTISQRGSSFTSVGASANTFTMDRWKFYVQNSTARFTVSQNSESPDEFGGSMKIECTTTDTSLASTDEVYLEQRLEGQDLQDFAKGTSFAKEYTISFYAKTNRPGTYIVNLLSRDNTTGGVSASYTVSDTGWNRYTVTFPPDIDANRKDNNDNGEALRVLFWFVAGSAVNNVGSHSLNTVWANSTDTGRATGQVNFADSTSNIFYLTGCQLEVGKQTTEFEHRSYGEELALCQRYYEKWGEDTNNTGTGRGMFIGCYSPGSSGVANSARFFGWLPMAVRKRTSSPTITEQSILLEHPSLANSSHVTSIGCYMPNTGPGLTIEVNCLGGYGVAGDPYHLSFYKPNNNAANIPYIAIDAEM